MKKNTKFKHSDCAVNSKREPTQVRGTGDWSSDSKLSAIQNGYWEDPYFEILNKNQDSPVRNRTSLICRGYYVRFRICNYFLNKTIRGIEGPFQMVCLGCGMDSAFFRVCSDSNNLSRFFELDFPSVISRKKEIINSEERLRSLAESKLVLVPVDLRDLTSVQECLKMQNFDFGMLTLFYSECVVNYLQPAENDAILHWITANIPNSIWLAYEQCFPKDTFGRIMVSHFERNGCPLLSISEFSDMNDQKLQLQNAGFKHCSVHNVWDLFVQIATEETKKGINSSSSHQFDEYESFVSTCLHYSLRFGTNVKLKMEFRESFVQEERAKQVIPLKTVEVVPCTYLVTGHSAVFVAPYLIIIGGYNQQSERLSQCALFKYPFPSENVEINPILMGKKSSANERLHTSAVYAHTANLVYIFCGRKSPKTPCSNDLVSISPSDKSNTYDVDGYHIHPTSQDRPSARWRHSMATFTIGDNEHRRDYIFLFGGKNAEAEIFGDCWIFDIRASKWRTVNFTGQPGHFPSSRHSHSICDDPKRNSIFMIGGISGNDLNLCEDTIWQYDYKVQSWTRWNQSNLVAQKFGHSSLIHEDNLIILGGNGNSSCMIVEHFLALINLETKVELLFKLELGLDQMFLPFGFSAVIANDGNNSNEHVSLIVFGGGGNCFSFGTHFNKFMLKIKLPIS